MNIPKPIINIINRLQSSDFQAYVVGGAVRDICMRRSVTDWDVATSATPEDIKTVFKGQRCFSLKHETVTIADSGRNYEITTFRGSDRSEKTIESDLMHRDFTINSMAYDIRKDEILDPNGGRQDIKDKLVRGVGDPDSRFHEDPLRMLRAVRISTELGFKIDDRTLESISSLSFSISSIALERVREELMKILLCPRPSKGINLARRTGILKEILPELIEGYRKKQNHYHRFTVYRHIMETVDKVEAEPSLRVAALLHDIAKPRVRKKVNGRFRFYDHEKESAVLAKEILERLKFSNEMRFKVINLIVNHMVQYESEWSDGAVRRFMRRVGQENLDDLLRFRKADLIAHGIIDHKLGLLEELTERINDVRKEKFIGSPHDLAVSGTDVMEKLGLPPGPEIGRVMNQLLERVTDSPELNTKKALIAVLATMRL